MNLILKESVQPMTENCQVNPIHSLSKHEVVRNRATWRPSRKLIAPVVPANLLQLISAIELSVTRP